MNLLQIPERFRKTGNPVLAGAGSQGVVYRFLEDDTVVLKVIECTKEIQYQSALHEIKIMKSLARCNRVIQLLDYTVVTEQNRKNAFLLLECAEKMENSAFLIGMSAKDAVRLCIQLCEALIECRECDVMHLDIKPQNIFLDKQGILKLGDFGVSLYKEELRENTKLRGSLTYMAPEVYRNRTNSEQSEIYSVGMVLYWLLNNGKLPFEQEMLNNREASLYKRLAGTAFPEIPFKDAVVRDTLVEIFRRICAFEPENRPQTFEELRGELNKLYNIVPNGPLVKNRPVRLPVPVPGTAGKTVAQGDTLTPDSDTQDADGFSSTVSLADEIPKEGTAHSGPVPQMTDVQFSAVAPKEFIKGEYTMIELVMYEEQYRSVVDEIMDAMDRPVWEKKSGIIPVEKRSGVRVVLTSPDLEIEDNEEQGEWNGGYLNFSFAVFLPEKYSKRQVLFLATVYINDLPVTKLKFPVQCHSLREQRPDVIRQDVLSAFISYASQDRGKVVTIIQGMKKIRPDIDIFFDVDNLRSGENWEKALRREIENRDVLFLCWSHFAKESKWVEMEWRYALENKGEDCIEPIPIEHPAECPPPKELEMKHFNDKLLYLANENITN